MEKGKPIYKNIFTRDFTLASVQIWVRPESNSVKVWTDEKLPFSPYIVAERASGVVNAFYDPDGIAWMKRMLVKKIKNDIKFLKLLSEKYEEAYKVLKKIYTDNSVLSNKELTQFLSTAESFWGWFEALWWVWELTPEEQKGIMIPSEVFTLRINTQEIVPEIERIARNSLTNIYSDLGDLVEVLSISEISSGAIPSRDVLEDRHRGYFFIGDKLITGKSRSYIEDNYNILFEQILVDGEKNEINGQTIFKGKVRGMVKLLYGPKQIFKVNDGDIVASPMTMPDVLPAMKKAAAFITDEGGLLSHAAIIARELKKPCIIGTKIATKVLHDGDLVEVDANQGIVKILKRAN